MDLNFGLAVMVSVKGDIMIMVPHAKINSFLVQRCQKMNTLKVQRNSDCIFSTLYQDKQSYTANIG